MRLPRVLFITGTDTGVGKTITTAALATGLAAAGRSVAVYKPTQAGLENGVGDVDVVAALSGVKSVHEGIRLRHPMAPAAAAERERVALPEISQHREAIARLATGHDTTLVEGAGGLLVELDDDGYTLADIATEVGETGLECAFVVVCRPGLGTLNHTALTLEALARRNQTVTGLVIGSWPAEPDAIEASNRIELGRMGPVLGAIPAGAGRLMPKDFQANAPGWLVVPDSVPAR